jgi:hypothetical protein
MKAQTALKPLKALHPRSPDLKYTGTEPEWRTQPEPENRNSRLIAAFTWYGYHYDKKTVKEFVIDYLVRSDRQKDAKEFARVPESTVSNQVGWLCRMSLMGLQLNEHEQLTVNNAISGHIHSIRAVKEVVKVAEKETVKGPTIQDRLREKVEECAGELEGMFDDFVVAGAKMSADFKPVAVMRGMNVAPQMINIIADHWKSKVAEFEEVLKGKDAQLVEGYSPWTKVQIKNFLKFAEQVVADCGSYVQIKKVERKPRAKKAVSPEKQASKFKFLKEFSELKLTSEPPAKLVGASEAWLYDTKKRKLVHVVADSHAGSVSVKGSSIIGFDPTQTQQKTLRKPAEQIKALLSGGKPAARKYFKDIRATEIKFNGRGNENLVILKTY